MKSCSTAYRFTLQQLNIILFCLISVWFHEPLLLDFIKVCRYLFYQTLNPGPGEALKFEWVNTELSALSFVLVILWFAEQFFIHGFHLFCLKWDGVKLFILLDTRRWKQIFWQMFSALRHDGQFEESVRVLQSCHPSTGKLLPDVCTARHPLNLGKPPSHQPHSASYREDWWTTSFTLQKCDFLKPFFELNWGRS